MTDAVTTGRDVAIGHAMGLFTAMAWGSSYAFSKPIVAHVDPVAFSVARYVLATLLLFAIMLVQRQSPAVPWRVLPSLVGLGLIGFTLFQGIWGIALSHTTASKAAVILATAPIFGALIATAGGERPSPVGWLGVLLGFGGVYVVINDGVTGFVFADGVPLGDLLFLVNACAWAGYTALSRPVIRQIGPLRTAAWAGAIGIGLLAPVGLWRAPSIAWEAVPAHLWLNFAWVVTVSGAFGLLTWYGGLARLGLTRVMMYLYVSPVLAVALAAAMLGELLSLAQAAGAAAVLAGIALTSRGRAAAVRTGRTT